MYQLNIAPKDVHSLLSKHILADGYDIVYDIENSQGVYMRDSKSGSDFLDFFTCFASVPLGYNHPKMMEDESFRKNLMLAALANPSNSDIYTTQYAEFVDSFAKLAVPDYLPHAFFVAGGGLAIENALKTAMDWKVQKNFAKGHTNERGFKVIHFEKAFHGRTGYTMSMTNGNPEKVKWFARFDWPRIVNPAVEYPLTDQHLEDVIARECLAIEQINKAFQENPDDICAIIIEPVQAEGGDHHFRREFMEALRVLADENECLLIYDEVQTGVGLSGKFWCHEHFGERARPDIIAFGKKMQVCGILAGKRIDEVPHNVFRVSSRLNSTWGGNLVDMVRASKIMQIIHEDHLVENAKNTGEYLQSRLRQLAESTGQISNVRGLGLLAAFNFKDRVTRDRFIKLGFQKNVMFIGCGESAIRFRPALIMQPADIDHGIAIASEILKGM